MNQPRIRTIVFPGAIGLFVLGFVLAGSVALAQNANSVNRGNSVGRLEAAKLRACEKRQTAINRVLSHLADRAKRQLDVFSKIADRVETFYTDQGRTMSNYDALVADVNAKKIVVSDRVTTLQKKVVFDCFSDDPQGLAEGFKDQLKTTIASMKDFKASVRNLIVGVKSAQGQASSNRNASIQNANSAQP